MAVEADTHEGFRLGDIDGLIPLAGVLDVLTDRQSNRLVSVSSQSDRSLLDGDVDSEDDVT